MTPRRIFAATQAHKRSSKQKIADTTYSTPEVLPATSQFVKPSSKSTQRTKQTEEFFAPKVPPKMASYTVKRSSKQDDYLFQDAQEDVANDGQVEQFLVDNDVRTVLRQPFKSTSKRTGDTRARNISKRTEDFDESDFRQALDILGQYGSYSPEDRET